MNKVCVLLNFLNYLTIITRVFTENVKIAIMFRDHFKTLQLAIEETLMRDRSEGDALSCYKVCFQLAEEAIRGVCEELEGDPFFDKQEEVWFYKEEAPLIWGLYLYYMRLVEIEALRKVRSRERFRELLREELNTAELYPEKYSICTYYYMGRTDRDERYFTRRGSTARMGMFLDRDMAVGTCRLAWMRANESLREWLGGALEALESQAPGSNLKCKLSKMEAVELFKSLHETGVFGNWSFARVISWVTENMGIEVKNYDRLLQDLQRRKLERTSFLDRLKEGLLHYMDEKL